MFGFLPHRLFTTHLGQSTTGLSPRIWGKVSGSLMDSSGQKRLVLAGDDFVSLHGALSGTAGEYYGEAGGYKSYQDSGCTIAQADDAKGGVAKLSFDGTGANDEIWLQSCGGAGVLGAISDTAADAHLTAFECRVKFSAITDDTLCAFIGLAEEGLIAADTKVDTTGVLASKDLIGFDVVAADGDALNFVYRKADQDLQTKISGVQALAADTWYKLGFLYDPNPPTPDSKRIRVFVDNTEQSTYVTATDIAAATFPDGEELSFLVGGKQVPESAANIQVDWWAFAQAIA